MTQPNPLQLDKSEKNRPGQLRLRLRVPRKYHQEPVISELASKHNLKVNILAALLGEKGQDSGWFDVVLTGTSRDIDNALIYLSELNIEVLHESDLEIDGW